MSSASFDFSEGFLKVSRIGKCLFPNGSLALIFDNIFVIQLQGFEILQTILCLYKRKTI